MKEKSFVIDGKNKLKIEEYIEGEFKGAEYSSLDIQKTPLGTKLIIHANRPGVVIGKSGARIRELTETVRDRFKIENPLIEIDEHINSSFDAKIAASQLASALERGLNFRKSCHDLIKRVMRAGALGIELRVTGKIQSQRSKSWLLKEGFVIHSGEPAEVCVKKGYATASLKPGEVGVKVRIIPPDLVLPDKIIIRKEEKAAIEEIPEDIERALVEKKAVVEEVKESKPKKAAKEKTEKPVESEKKEAKIKPVEKPAKTE